MLLSLALDLSSGTGVLDWPPGRREALLESLGQLLAEPGWAEAGATAHETDQRQRADWIRRTGRKPFKRPITPDKFRIEVVTGDPADGEPIETRVLIDGRPVVPAVRIISTVTRRGVSSDRNRSRRRWKPAGRWASRTPAPLPCPSSSPSR
jgi:hypothetical protein